MNTWRQHARREAGAVIRSSNRHLICTLGKKNSSYGNRGGPREAIEAKRGLWKVRRTGHLPLQHFSLFTDFTLGVKNSNEEDVSKEEI